MNSTITKRYRVVATTTTGFVDPKIDTTVKWEGTDTDELSREYPPSDIMFADPLDQKEIEDGFIITRFTFEQQLADGSWEQIDDPRRRLTPMTDYERAIDEENRRLFPGDYITECQDCGYDDCQCDDYSVNCTSCDDHGCAKCDPNWCRACVNNGCATCDPGGVCKGCKRYMADVETLDENGQCSDCAYYASLCRKCGHDQSDGDDHLCSTCRSNNEWEAAPKCDNCYNAVVAKEGDNCQSCQEFLDSACVACQYDVANGDDKLCSDCRQSYADEDAYWRSYYVWWRRALRACKFWR